MHLPGRQFSTTRVVCTIQSCCTVNNHKSISAMMGDGENNLRILYMYFENCQSAEETVICHTGLEVTNSLRVSQQVKKSG